MPIYKIELSHVETTTWIGEAENAEQAKEIAQDFARDNHGGYWEVEDVREEE